MKGANIFKGLDLIDTVPEELWMEFHDIVQETGIKTIPKKKKCNKAKWLSEEALQIAEKREAKGKRIEKVDPSEYQVSKNSKERFKKKTFLSYQCKAIEEKNRMGKSRDLFKKT